MAHYRQRSWAQTVNPSGGGGSTPTFGTVQWTPGSDSGLKPEIAVQSTFTNFALSRNQTIGVQTLMPSLALSRNQGIAVQTTGSVLGAPFFMGIGITTQTAVSTSVVMTPDATASDGDYLVVNIGSSTIGNTEAFTAPAGWTLSLSSTHASAVSTPNLRTYTKFAGAGEPATYTWTGGVSVSHIATIIRLRGVNTTTPINVSGSSGILGNATDPVSPSITTTAANCFMVSVCVQSNTLEQTYTPPAGYTERADQAGSALTVVQVTGETATRVQAAAAASGTATHDSNQLVASNYVAHHLAIAPAEIFF